MYVYCEKPLLILYCVRNYYQNVVIVLYRKSYHSDDAKFPCALYFNVERTSRISQFLIIEAIVKYLATTSKILVSVFILTDAYQI